MKHLLVTNDFPPKIGGIQSLLWEWWRRLPADRFAVLTTAYDGATEWDAAQPFAVHRIPQSVMLPQRSTVRRINQLVQDFGADFVMLDPALPLGAAGRWLDVPYGLVLHGAEVTVPGRLPVSKQLLSSVLRGASRIVAAGGYPAAEAEHAAGRELSISVIPCGVDTGRFEPLDEDARSAARERFGLPHDRPVILGLSRLVPRKGFDTLIRAGAQLAGEFPGLTVAIAGAGRDRERLEKLAVSTGSPVRFLGRVDHEQLPALYGCVDVFAMLCRNRWGGLEQEGFGIVFLEAAAAGVPQIAGRSGGAHEAVADGETGFVINPPSDVGQVVGAIRKMLHDPALRAQMGVASRSRVVSAFSYEVLTRQLGAALDIDC